MITLIAAIDKNNLIGNNGKLPWKCHEDMDFFKKKTTGNIVVMGRKTYESIGKPLANRLNVVISKTKDWLDSALLENVMIMNSFEKFITCEDNKNRDMYIIGGRSIYEQSLKNEYPDRLLISKINEEYIGDEYFPEIPSVYSFVQCFRISDKVVVSDYRKNK